jgi:hypothetical protein
VAGYGKEAIGQNDFQIGCDRAAPLIEGNDAAAAD